MDFGKNFLNRFGTEYLEIGRKRFEITRELFCSIVTVMDSKGKRNLP